MIPFPKLNRTDTMELPLVAAASGILGGICFSFTRIGAAILGFPALAISCYRVTNGIQNHIRRFTWSGSFDARLSRRAALNRIREQPSEFVLYVQYYSGGFDRMNLAPAAILEHVENAMQFAIHPASWKIIDDCKNLDIPLRDPHGNAISN